MFWRTFVAAPLQNISCIEAPKVIFEKNWHRVNLTYSLRRSVEYTPLALCFDALLVIINRKSNPSLMEHIQCKVPNAYTSRGNGHWFSKGFVALQLTI